MKKHTLREDLRKATREIHTQAEAHPLMQTLLAECPRAADYILYLDRMHAYYEALESGLQSAQNRMPALEPFGNPSLRRAPALEQDRSFFRRLHSVSPRPSPAAEALRKHLTQLCRDRPVFLAAHAYVRYFGDLAGGQILQNRIRKAFALTGEDGLRFYLFGNLPGAATLRASMSAALDRLPIRTEAHPAFQEETCNAFLWNLQLFDEVLEDWI